MARKITGDTIKSKPDIVVLEASSPTTDSNSPNIEVIVKQIKADLTNKKESVQKEEKND